MESKGLNMNSFHRNQRLLDAINLLLISLKLSGKKIPLRESVGQVEEAKQELLNFFNELETLVKKVESGEEEPMVGTDTRRRSFAKSFVEAKCKVTKFKSPLFRSEFSSVRNRLVHASLDGDVELIQSLTELRILLEAQISLDTKNIIKDI